MSKLQKARLGRGLSSLIGRSEPMVAIELPPSAPTDQLAGQPPAEVAETQPMGPLVVAIDSIHPNPHQPRREMDQARLAELAASIKSTGLIQPIVVRQVGDIYQLIAGERRWRASKLAGLTEIPVILREVSSYEQAQMALVENIQREDLNPIDRAESYRALLDQLGLTQAELAARLGEDRSGIANHLRLLELPDNVRQSVRQRKLSLGNAKLLAGIDDPNEQARLADLAVSEDLSVRALEAILALPKLEPADAPVPSKPNLAPHLKELETAIARQLGLRVQVRAVGKGKKGRLVVHYSSLDEFDALIARLGVQLE